MNGKHRTANGIQDERIYKKKKKQQALPLFVSLADSFPFFVSLPNYNKNKKNKNHKKHCNADQLTLVTR